MALKLLPPHTIAERILLQIINGNVSDAKMMIQSLPKRLGPVVGGYLIERAPSDEFSRVLRILEVLADG